MSYPEHDKMREVKPQSQAIGGFLEWLEEQGIWLANHADSDVHLSPFWYSKEKILAKFFGIDLAKIGEEKDAMVAELRAMNEPKELAK